MNANIAFELKAGIFNRMTGMLAPGKDDRSGTDYKARQDVWDVFIGEYHVVLDAMIGELEYLDII